MVRAYCECGYGLDRRDQVVISPKEGRKLIWIGKVKCPKCGYRSLKRIKDVKNISNEIK
jgi:hypothetical protein